MVAQCRDFVRDRVRLMECCDPDVAWGRAADCAVHNSHNSATNHSSLSLSSFFSPTPSVSGRRIQPSTWQCGASIARQREGKPLHRRGRKQSKRRKAREEPGYGETWWSDGGVLGKAAQRQCWQSIAMCDSKHPNTSNNPWSIHVAPWSTHTSLFHCAPSHLHPGVLH